MGRRQRKRQKQQPSVKDPGTDYIDADGNTLTLRNSLSAGATTQLSSIQKRPASSQDDAWKRQQELLFELIVKRWVIADLPITKQKELLARYRFADADTRRWIGKTLDEHLEAILQPPLRGD